MPIEYPTVEIEEEYNMDVIDSITITPIAKNFESTPKVKEFDPNDVTPSSPDSKRDYGEQLERMNEGMKPMWDDSKYNKAKQIQHYLPLFSIMNV